MSAEDWQTACKDAIGRSRAMSDSLAPERVTMMELCLNRASELEAGDPLPPLWHWIYFIDPVPTSELGEDGHERLGRFLPPIRYPRRMWAGGDVTFKAPLIIGRAAEKTTRIDNVEFKQGKSGPLCFVTVHHRIRQDGRDAVDEIQTIVYREKGAAKPTPNSETAQPGDDTMAIGRLQMFRYSALTYNAHRIHYDERFVTDVEGYPGLLVHGPLLATELAGRGASMDAERQLARFRYRALQPVFENEPFCVEGDRTATGAELRIVKPRTGPAMQATIEWKPST